MAKVGTTNVPCLRCGGRTHVDTTRPGDGNPIIYYRLRKCLDKECGGRFVTVEVFAPEQAIPGHVRIPDEEFE